MQPSSYVVFITFVITFTIRSVPILGNYVAANDHVIVLAENWQNRFSITDSHNRTKDHLCVTPYSVFSMISVEKLAIGTEQHSNYLSFVFVGLTNSTFRERRLYIVTLKPKTPVCFQTTTTQLVLPGNLTSTGTDCALAVHPSGLSMYVVGDQFAICYDVEQNQLIPWHLWGTWTDVYPKAMVVSRDHRIYIAVYASIMGGAFPRLLEYTGITWPPVLGGFLSVIDDTESISVGIRTLPEHTPMSLHMHQPSFPSDSMTIAVGLPFLDTVVICLYNSKRKLMSKIHRSAEKNVRFGQSVVIIDEGIYAVLSTSLPTLPWSNSRVQFYSTPDHDSPNESSPHPIFVFPNNQQIIAESIGRGSYPFDIVDLTYWSWGFGVTMLSRNLPHAIFVPGSPPGIVSIDISQEEWSRLVIYDYKPCMAGTQKKNWSLGPCYLCPPLTKNNGTSGVQCDRCLKNNGSFCFRGTTREVDKHRVSNREQSYPYPKSSGSTGFDDVLFNHVFKLERSTRLSCLIVAPMFWASVAIVIGFILFIVMIILSCTPKLQRRRTFLKRIFTRLDLIGEGQLWLGGLVTLAIAVLIAFTCRFSMSFSRLYPIERVSNDARMALSCNPNMINAKFSSTLQLISIFKNKEEIPIFNMLDDQNITLTIEFISTNFRCENVSIQQNLDRDQSKSVNDFNCSYEEDNAGILIISTLLPEHVVTMQFNLEGPFFVGAVRVCLTGAETTSEEGKYTVKQLDFCRFVYPQDEILSIHPTIDIEMTKIVNHTARGLENDQKDLFSGLWLPALTTKNTLWDSHIYKNATYEYRRHLNWKLQLIVDITESKFYMRNSQEPIAHGYEIVFKTILFSMLFLELFGLMFLVGKLAIVPLVKLIQQNSCFSMPFENNNNAPSTIEMARLIDKLPQELKHEFKKAFEKAEQEMATSTPHEGVSTVETHL